MLIFGKKIRLRIALGLALALGLAVDLLVHGTGGGLSCSSQETKDTIGDITREQILKEVAIFFPYPNEEVKAKITGDGAAKIAVGVEDILTKARDGTTGRLDCAGTVIYETPAISNSPFYKRAETHNIPVTYTVERTDEGRTYVTVYGLPY